MVAQQLGNLQVTDYGMNLSTQIVYTQMGKLRSKSWGQAKFDCCPQVLEAQLD